MWRYRVGRSLQLIGLLILPFAIASELVGEFGLGQSMLVAAAGAAFLCGIRRPKPLLSGNSDASRRGIPGRGCVGPGSPSRGGAACIGLRVLAIQPADFTAVDEAAVHQKVPQV